MQRQLEEVMNKIGNEEQAELLLYLESYINEYHLNLDDIIDCYRTMVDDTLEESVYFFQNDCKYRYSTYAEAADFMKSKHPHYMRQYQIGLILSNYLWPTHLDMRRTFIEWIRNQSGSRYLEIGIGHGCNFSAALQNSSFKEYVGLDISEDSIHTANTILTSNPDFEQKNYTLKLLDFFDLNEADRFDIIVASEVLEHVENPKDFLFKIARLCNQNAHVFITTALNSPMIDHISLFTSPDDLYALFENTGLNIDHIQFLHYHGKTLESALKRKVPIIPIIQASKL